MNIPGQRAAQDLHKRVARTRFDGVRGQRNAWREQLGVRDGAAIQLVQSNTERRDRQRGNGERCATRSVTGQPENPIRRPAAPTPNHSDMAATASELFPDTARREEC